MHHFKGKTYPCCTSLTMGVIGGKWKSVILYHLIDGPLRYTVLRKKVEGITERSLSLQLKNLEGDGVVKRTAFAKKPPLKVEYALTPLGVSLIPLLKAIADWGDSVAEQRIRA